MLNKKIRETIKYNIKAFLTLFICEIGGLIIFGLCFVYLHKTILELIGAIIISMLAYSIFIIGGRLSECGQFKGSILYLSKNTIHMKSKYVKKSKDFIDDYNLIIDYAKSNNIDELHTTTHYQILKTLLRGYKYSEWVNTLNKCKHMDYKEVVYIKTQNVNIEIKNHLKSINPCGKYEYKGMLFLFHLKKIFEIKDFYDITIYLKNN